MFVGVCVWLCVYIVKVQLRRPLRGKSITKCFKSSFDTATLALGTVAIPTVGTRIKVIPSFGKGTLPTLVFKVGGPQGYPSDLSPGVS